MTTQENKQPDKQSQEQRPLDRALQPGGVYVVNGKVFDGEGNELDGWTVDQDGNAVQPGGAPANTLNRPASQTPKNE